MGSLWCWDHREACPEGSAQIRSRRQTSSLTIPEDGSRATRKARPKPNHFLAEARKRGRTGTKTAETKEKNRRNDFFRRRRRKEEEKCCAARGKSGPFADKGSPFRGFSVDTPGHGGRDGASASARGGRRILLAFVGEKLLSAHRILDSLSRSHDSSPLIA